MNHVLVLTKSKANDRLARLLNIYTYMPILLQNMHISSYAEHSIENEIQKHEVNVCPEGAVELGRIQT